MPECTWVSRVGRAIFRIKLYEKPYSRAAIVASLDSADTDPEVFVRQLGIERVQALVQDEPWILTGELLAQIETDALGAEILPVDERVLRRLQNEDERRAENRSLIATLKAEDASLAGDPILAPRTGRSVVVDQPLDHLTHFQAPISIHSPPIAS